MAEPWAIPLAISDKHKGELKLGALRWAVGTLSGLIGAMMLVAPHQFRSPVYTAFQGSLALWGITFLATGIGLISLASTQPRRPAVVIIHLLVGAELFVLAYGFALVGGWTGTANWAVFGLGTAAAPFLPSLHGVGRPAKGGHWFAMIVGGGAMLTGVTILVAPGQFNGPFMTSFAPSYSGLGWRSLAVDRRSSTYSCEAA